MHFQKKKNGAINSKNFLKFEKWQIIAVNGWVGNNGMARENMRQLRILDSLQKGISVGRSFSMRVLYFRVFEIKGILGSRHLERETNNYLSPTLGAIFKIY